MDVPDTKSDVRRHIMMALKPPANRGGVNVAQAALAQHGMALTEAELTTLARLSR